MDNSSLLFLRLPFLTTPVPVEYTTVRKEAIDLVNDIISKKSWDAT